MNKENKKFFGMKPSYKFMKNDLIKKSIVSYSGHISNLVYYAIKHDLNEEDAINYFKFEINRSNKKIKNSPHGIFFDIDYHLVKDLFNVNLDDFELKEYRSYKSNYDYYIKQWNIDYNKIHIKHRYNYNYSKDMHQKLFRDYNNHVVYLYDTMDRDGWCNHIIGFTKEYDDNGENDKVKIFFSESYLAAGSNCSKNVLEIRRKAYLKICIDFWHFMKLLDYSENPNDINIKKLYSRKEVSQVYDITK